jgi:osmotically-inducible protein OsmY
MSDRLLTHDATDWIRTLEKLKSAANRAPRSPAQAPGGEARSESFVGLAQAADGDLASRIAKALQATGYLPLRNLHVVAADGIAILRGIVSSYYMKQIAQATASGVRGVSDVHNELEVVPPARA